MKITFCCFKREIQKIHNEPSLPTNKSIESTVENSLSTPVNSNKDFSAYTIKVKNRTIKPIGKAERLKLQMEAEKRAIEKGYLD